MRLVALFSILAMSACAPTSSVQNSMTALKEDIRATNTVTGDEAFAALKGEPRDTCRRILARTIDSPSRLPTYCQGGDHYWGKLW